MWVQVGLVALFYFILHPVAGLVLKTVSRDSYNKLHGTPNLHEFSNRVNSMVNALGTSLASLYILLLADGGWDIDNKVIATCTFCSTILVWASGYFLWDVVDAVRNVKESGVSFVIHGLFCFLVYCGTLYFHVLHFYGLVFLSFELSTPFGNIAWLLRFLPSLSKAPQWVVSLNKTLFAVTFITVRLIFGVYWSYWFFVDSFKHLSDLQEAQSPSYDQMWSVLSFYMLGNVVLNALNFFWFIKIAFWVQKDEKKEKKR